MEQQQTKRFYPEGWRIIPRALFEFCAPAWGDQQNNALRGYPIDFITGLKAETNQSKIANTVPEKSSSLSPSERLASAKSESQKSKKVNSGAFAAISAGKNSVGHSQAALSPFDLRVLSELIYLRDKHQRSTSHIFSPTDPVPRMLAFKPSELCHSLGLSLSGSAYDRIEKSLVALGKFFLDIKPLNRERFFGQEDPLNAFRSHHLMTTVDTGRKKIVDGKEWAGAENRTLYWRVKFGLFLNHIDSKKGAWFSYPKKVVQEMGRSSVAQWLALFSFSTSRSGPVNYDYKLRTLVAKANINGAASDRLKKLLERPARKKEIDTVDKTAITTRLKLQLANRAADTIRKAFERLQETKVMLCALLCVAETSAESKVRIIRHDLQDEIHKAALPAYLRSKVITLE